jgi:hypothetical protein
MNTLLQQQLNELLTDSSTRSKLTCESALRVGAATLHRGRPGEITATTVVCDVAADDVEAFASLVSEIGDEYGLETRIQQRPGSYSVRFTCSPAEAVRVGSTPGVKSALARLLRR